MTKRKDGIVIVSTFKKTKGPSKSTVSSMKEPIQTSKEELDDMNGFIVNGVFRLKPNDDNNRLLLQTNWYIANNNEVKAREILRKLGFNARTRKAYIEDEKSLYKRKPFDSGFMELHNKPMPSEFRVRGH
tara:strand:+ start:121 stop:510 length:390 start_codon:yes stop_codon:yes gene_type:complete